MSNKNLRLKLAKLLLRFATMVTDKATLYCEGDFAVDTEVFVEDENGEMVPAADGEYTTEEKVYVVAEGKITEIRDVKPEEKPEEKPEGFEEEKPDYSEAINTLLAAVEALTERVDAMAGEIEEIKKEMTPDIEDEFSKKEKKNNKPAWDKF